jgi:hypothetical protein
MFMTSARERCTGLLMEGDFTHPIKEDELDRDVTTIIRRCHRLSGDARSTSRQPR